MRVDEIAEKMGWTLLAGAQGTDQEVKGCYIGDLLSWVMGRAQEQNLWLTVMGNVNAVAVATLAGVSAIVLTENAALDEDARSRAELQGVPIYSAADNTWQTAVKLFEGYGAL